MSHHSDDMMSVAQCRQVVQRCLDAVNALETERLKKKPGCSGDMCNTDARNSGPCNSDARNGDVCGVDVCSGDIETCSVSITRGTGQYSEWTEQIDHTPRTFTVRPTILPYIKSLFRQMFRTKNNTATDSTV